MQRNKQNIIKDILETLNNSRELNYSKLMRKSNLNSINCNKYIDFLTEKKCMERTSNRFRITNIGLDLLWQLKEICL